MEDPTLYAVGQLVHCRNEVCRIKTIEKSFLGFNHYQVFSLETYQHYIVPKHEIQPVVLDEVTEVCETDWDTPIILADPTDVQDTAHDVPEPAATAVHSEASVKPATQGRHAVMTASDLDEVAAQRLAPNTEHQTRWAVKLLKGK